MARRAPSPVEIAIDRLAKLASAATSPARTERAAREIVAGWRTSADPDIARRWTGELLADVTTGLRDAQDQADNVDTSEPGAAKHAFAVVTALKVTRDALTAEMERQ